MLEKHLHDAAGHGQQIAMDCLQRPICIVVKPQSTATGFWIGTLQGLECIMTNNHVFASIEDAYGAKAIFDHRKTGTNLEVHILPEKGFWTSKTFDATIIAFDAAPLQNCEDPVYPLRLLTAGDEQPCKKSSVMIIGHPRGRPQEIAMRQIKHYDDGGKVHYTMDTEPGNSGSPVINDQMRVAFLHSRAGGPDSNCGFSVQTIMEAFDDDPFYAHTQLFQAVMDADIETVKIVIAKCERCVNNAKKQIPARDHGFFVNDFVGGVFDMPFVHVTPVAHAVVNGHAEIVQLLIVNTANVAKGHWGYDETFSSPLNIACSKGHIAIVRKLIQAKADVNRDLDDRAILDSPYLRTPLYCARRSHHNDVVDALRAAGAMDPPKQCLVS